MAEVDNSLLPEHLEGIQDRLRHLDHGPTTILAEIRSIKGHKASFMSSDVAQDASIAELALRIERIARRLNLRDEI
jgi:ferritin-like protein